MVFTLQILVECYKVCLHCEQRKVMKCHQQIACHLISCQRDCLCNQNQKLAKCETLETHALTSAKEEAWPLNTTLCFLFLKKLNNEFKMLSDVPFCFSLHIMQLCHTLSNALSI